jgi:hypothetical protein
MKTKIGICTGCNIEKLLMRKMYTFCNACYTRERDTGSYKRDHLKCNKCSKQLFFGNESGFCEPCYRVECWDSIYKRQRERILSRIDKEKEYQKAYREKNKEKNKEYKKKYYQDNKEELLLKCVEYYSKNSDLIKKRVKTWKKTNGKRCYAGDKLRKERKAKRTLNKCFEQDVKIFYTNCPEGMTVDHIIPLKNNKVSGLHVVWNFQYLSPEDNSIKHNKFDGTYENEGWKNKISK